MTWKRTTIATIDAPAPIEELIRTEYKKDKIANKALNAIIDPKATPPLNTRRTQWREAGQLLIKDDRIYVPENDKIK